MTAQDQRSPRVALAEDHRNLDRLLDRLRATVRSDDRDAEQTAWSRLEKALLTHLDVEEMFVFPAIAAAEPGEVAVLRREHDEIRSELGALGLAFELHTVRAEAIERLCARLRDHAAREESLAYEAADRSVTIEIARAMLRRLGGLVGRVEHTHAAPRSPGEAT